MESEIMDMTDRDILKEYLWQYSRAKKRKRTLERRLQEFREEMGTVKAIQYSDMPKAPSISNMDGPVVSEVIRAMEIEERIAEQKAECQKAILNVMKIMDFLSMTDRDQALERKIIEARHIDDLSWEETCEEIALTRNPATIHYNAGLDRLLTFKKVQKTVTAYRKELEKIQSKK